nr:MAG TPA: hypothetical protein [Caudoviricetes sp.]
MAKTIGLEFPEEKQSKAEKPKEKPVKTNK